MYWVKKKKKKSSFRVYFLALFSNINIKPKQVFLTGGYINGNPSAEMSKLVNHVMIDKVM